MGFTGLASLRVSNLVTGLALAVLALGFGSAYERTYGMGWTAVAIGVWAIIAPWVVAGPADTTDTIINNVVTGAVAVCAALATTSLGAAMRR